MSADRRARSAAILALLLAIGGSIAALAAEPAGRAAAILDEARAAQGDYRTFRARFEQERQISLFEGTLRSSGVFLLDRSGSVAWIVEQPEPLRVVLSREGIFADGRRVDRDAPAGVGPLRVARGFVDFFASSSAELSRDFEISAAAGDRVRLVPRREELRRWLAAVELELAGERRLPSAIVLEEAEGDRTTIRFREVEIDPALDADAFAP